MSEILYVLLVILFGVCSIPLLHFNTKRDLFEPIYWTSAYFLVIFGVRSIYAMSFGTPFLGDPPFSTKTINAWTNALFYIIISFLFFLVGYYSKFGVAVAKIFPPLPQHWSYIKIIFFTPLFLGIGFVPIVIFIQRWGLNVFLTQKQLTLTQGGTTYLYLLVDFIKFVLFISYIAVLVHRKMRAMTVISLVVVFLVGFAIGTKGYVLFSFLSIFIIYQYFSGQVRLKHLTVIVLLTILVFPLFNVYRHTSDLSQVLPATIDILTRPDILLHHLLSRFHDMDSLIFIIRDTPGTMDFQMGKTIAPLFVAWIPRMIWPDKPIISFAKIFGETYYAPWFAGTGIAPSPTIIGEAYLNFHVAGMFGIALISGILLRTLYHYLICRSLGLSGVFVYVTIFPFLITFWESDIAGLLGRAVFSFFMAIMISLLLANRR
jgi:hypothetical protein